MRQVSSSQVEYLLRGGVRRVVVGHKPCGEAPAVLRTETVRGGYEVSTAGVNVQHGHGHRFQYVSLVGCLDGGLVGLLGLLGNLGLLGWLVGRWVSQLVNRSAGRGCCGSRF